LFDVGFIGQTLKIRLLVAKAAAFHWNKNHILPNGPFIDDFPSYKPPFIIKGFSMAMLNNQRVNQSHIQCPQPLFTFVR